MNRVLPILTTPLVKLERFDHPEGMDHHDPREESTDCHAVSFVERGGFVLTAARQEWPMEAGMLLASGPGERYRCRHPERRPADVCLSIRYEAEFAEETIHAPGAPGQRGFRVRTLTNRLAYLKLLLDGVAAQPSAKLAAESLAGEILASSWSNGSESRHRFRPGQLAWYAERIRAACDLLRTEHLCDHSLASLARRFGMSPFHFARVFRELAGMPPHRYLLSVRLQQAARRLRDGASVTDACFASGFSHLSHFGRLFQRKFGVRPSEYPKARRSN